MMEFGRHTLEQWRQKKICCICNKAVDEIAVREICEVFQTKKLLEIIYKCHGSEDIQTLVAFSSAGTKSPFFDIAELKKKARLV